MATPDREATPSEHVLGHSDEELQRLAFQAGLIEPITRRLLADAGVEAGMCVLDVGTGRGDVAMLVPEIVGESGAVVGVDRAPAAIAVARQRVAELPNVSFRAGDPAEIAFASPFDAVVGRSVLQFQPDPAALLRLLASRLRPGGIVAFQEIDWSGHRSVPPVPSWDRCCQLVVAAIAAGGANLDTGSRLPWFFAAAGLPAPSLGMTTIVGAGANSHDVLERLAGLGSNRTSSRIPARSTRSCIGTASPANHGYLLTVDKTDEKDAVLIARLTGQLRCYIPEPVDERWARLRQLGFRREQLISELGGQLQQIRDLLECVWPAAAEAAAQPFRSQTWIAGLTVIVERDRG